MEKDNHKNKVSPWLQFLAIAFPVILIVKGLETLFPFITTEWGIATLLVIFFIIIGRK